MQNVAEGETINSMISYNILRDFTLILDRAKIY